MFYGVILLLISGLGLWFVESIPSSLLWLRYLAVTGHTLSLPWRPSAALSFTLSYGHRASGPRRLYFHHPRGSHSPLRENPSPPVVRASHERNVREEVKASQ